MGLYNAQDVIDNIKLYEEKNKKIKSICNTILKL